MKYFRAIIDGKERYGTVDSSRLHLFSETPRDNFGSELFLQKNLIPDGEIVSRDKVELTYLPPVARPGKIICVGRNYLAHAEEQGRNAEKRPLLFSKYPSNMVGHGSKITPPSTGQALDYEVELAVIIGKKASRVRENALDYVFGYTVANDLTLRDIQKTDPGSQWTRGKAFDQSLPIGPVAVTADEVDDIQDLDIWLSVNGDIRQRSNTRKMIYSVEYLIQYITESITLHPGDIILTGTPEGVGYFMDPVSTLKSGDFVSCGIEGIGDLNFSIK